MILQATSLYAGLLAGLLIYLSINVIKQRRRAKVSVGDGGDDGLLRAIRVQGNFTEYAPISLILIGLIEFNGFPVWVVHGLGVMLVAGRAMHATGLMRGDKDMRFRVLGMQLTFAVVALGAVINLAGFVWGFVR